MIFKGGRRDLVRKQKAVIDYVDKRMRAGNDSSDPKIKEAMQDFSRWNDESGIYKNKDENRKGLIYNGSDKLNVDLTK